MNWLKKLIAAVKKWWDTQESPADPSPQPVPEPVPEPAPEPAGAVDCIELMSWSSRSITWRGEPRSWPTNGDLSGEAILEVFRDGKWQGGKFEHCRNNMTSRGWENVKNCNPAHNQPYGIFKTLRPAVGEKARFRLISYDSTQFTNWLEGRWA